MTPDQWRAAAAELRRCADEWERKADETAICGVVSESGPNREPLACGWPPHGTERPHSWSTLPTFTPVLDSLSEEVAAP